MDKIAVGMLNTYPGLWEKCMELGMPHNCSRVVIDIDVNSVVTIYYETFGEVPMLSAMPDVLTVVKNARSEGADV